jgi:hypothetical protein
MSLLGWLVLVALAPLALFGWAIVFATARVALAKHKAKRAVSDLTAKIEALQRVWAATARTAAGKEEPRPATGPNGTN